MTQTVSWPAMPHPLAEGWRVEIHMPLHLEGKRAGKPVGWLNMNTSGGGVKAGIADWKVRKAWRLAAKLAFQRHRVPQGLGRIYVLIEFRFPTDAGQEPSNFELTVKPIIDALKPEKTGIRYNPAKKRREPFVDYGWGVIPDDNQRYLVRGPEMPVGPTLGTKNPIKGMVIVHIYPMPLEDQ